MQLRDYQLETLEAVKESFRKGNRRICVYAPTGAGKTIMFCEMIRRRLLKTPRANILILVDRTVLVQQSVEKLNALGVFPRIVHTNSLYASLSNPDSRVLVMTIQTLNRRLDDYADMIADMDLIIIDECHHSYSPQYKPIFALGKVIIGFTATPERTSKYQSLSELYDDLVISATLLELLSDNQLCKWKVFCQPQEHLQEQLGKLKLDSLGDYQQTGLGKVMSTPHMLSYTVDQWESLRNSLGYSPSTICFTVTKEHTELLCEEFLKRNIKADYVVCETPLKERSMKYRRLAQKDIDVLISVGVLTEGFDVPSTECCLMARPTQSKGLYIQQFGRVLRNSPGKSMAYLLDITGNYFMHKCPSQYNPHKVFSEKIQKKKDATGEAPMRKCNQCGATVPIQAKECPECGYRFPLELAKFVPINVSLADAVTSLTFSKFQPYSTAKGYLQQEIVFALQKGHNLDTVYHHFKQKFNRFPKRDELKFCLFGNNPTKEQSQNFLECLLRIAKVKGKDASWVNKWLKSQTHLEVIA